MVTDVISHREYWPFLSASAHCQEEKETIFIRPCCFSLFFKHGILAFRIAIVLYFVFFPNTCTYRPANYESRPGHGKLVTTDHASIITFILCVLCILLLISGIEPNPGPGTDDSFSCSKFYQYLQ